MSWAGPGLVCLSFFHDESGSGRNTFLFSRVVRLADTPDWSIFLLIWPTGAFWTSPVLINYPARFFQLLQQQYIFPPFNHHLCVPYSLPQLSWLIAVILRIFFHCGTQALKLHLLGFLTPSWRVHLPMLAKVFFFRRGSDLIDSGCVDFVDHNFFDLKVWALSHLIPAQSG